MSLNSNNSNNNVESNTFPLPPNPTPKKHHRSALATTDNLNSVDLLEKLKQQGAEFSYGEAESSDVLYKTALSGLLDGESLSRMATVEPPASPPAFRNSHNHEPSSSSSTHSGNISDSLRRSNSLTESDKENYARGGFCRAPSANLCRASADTYVVDRLDNRSPRSKGSPKKDRSSRTSVVDPSVSETNVFPSSQSVTPDDFVNENLKTELTAAQNKIKAQEIELEFYKGEVLRLMSENYELQQLVPKKSVTFNAKALTPEIIHADLPAGTPVRRGRRPEEPGQPAGTPVRSVSSSSGMRTSVLKKAAANGMAQAPVATTPRQNQPREQSTPFNDSLTVECEEASRAIMQLKQKFSERARVTSPEILKENPQSRSPEHRSSSESNAAATPRRVLKSMEDLSNQLNDVRLDSTPLRATEHRNGSRASETFTPDTGRHSVVSRVSIDRKQVSALVESQPIPDPDTESKPLEALKHEINEALKSESTDSDIVDRQHEIQDYMRCRSPEESESSYQGGEPSEISISVGMSRSEYPETRTFTRSESTSRAFSPTRSMSSAVFSPPGRRRGMPPKPEQRRAQSPSTSMSVMSPPLRRHNTTEPHMVSSRRSEASRSRQGFPSLTENDRSSATRVLSPEHRMLSPDSNTSMPPDLQPMAKAINSLSRKSKTEQPQSCKSPEPRSHSPTSKSESSPPKPKRISIANQSSQEKIQLEKRRQRFIEQQEKKRQAAMVRKKSTSENHISMASSPSDSPQLMRETSRRDRLKNKSVSSTSSAKTDRAALVQQRRDRARAGHNKEKERIQNTLNPPPPPSTRTQSASSSRLASKANTFVGKVNRTMNRGKSTSGLGHDNKQQVILAIEKTCLPGAVNKKDRKLIIEPIHTKLASKETSHLVVLFRNDRLQFRGVYRLETPEDENQENAINDQSALSFDKVSGQGPSKIVPNDVKAYYSYQTGRKMFNKMNGRTFGYNVVGMIVDESIWARSRPRRTKTTSSDCNDESTMSTRSYR